MKVRRFVTCLLAAFGLLQGGCNYDFPLTPKPTRAIDGKLLGDWVAMDKENAKEELMHVRHLDDSTYVIAFDHDIYRAFHSDFSGTAFLSVQDLNADNRKYLYYTWQLSADGAKLSLKGVSTKVVPETTKSPDEIQRLIKQNLGNPVLFGDEILFIRKSGPH